MVRCSAVALRPQRLWGVLGMGSGMVVVVVVGVVVSIIIIAVVHECGHAVFGDYNKVFGRGSAPE